MVIQGKIPGTESLVNIDVENGKIIRIEPCQPGSLYDFGGVELYLCPGFFDLQVNGFFGVDFNSPHLTPGGLHQAASSLASTGITGFFPTLITSSHEKMIRQLRIIGSAIKNDPLLQTMCYGIHLEGPYISPEDGPRGIHPLEHVRLPQWQELEMFQEACGGRIKCLTLAPELKGAIPFINKAVTHGIIIGMGHTHATEKVIEEAVQAGARLSCHLGNATPKPLSSYQNVIRKQLLMDRLTISIITDGFHLPREIVRDFVQTKGLDGIVLATDSMAGAGAPPGRYTLGELQVEVSSDGAGRSMATSRLAGSTLTMDRAITNVIQFAGIDLASAIRMANENGQRLFRKTGRGILPGDSPDLVLFEYQDRVKVRSTWIEGEKIF